MSVFTPIKKQEVIKVPNSHYIRTENKPGEEETKTTEPVNPDQPEAK